MSTSQLIQALEEGHEQDIIIEIDPDQKSKNLAEAKKTETEPTRRVSQTTGNGRDTPSYENYLTAYFPEKAVSQAERVMACESGGNPNAKNINSNGTQDSGLFQINDVHLNRVSGNRLLLMDPATNIKVAAQIYKEQGWRPWTCARKLGIV